MVPANAGQREPGGEAIRPDAGHTSSATGRLFEEPIRLAEVDSTNRYLSELADRGAPEGTAVLADTQTHGRGRLDRNWLDPPGSSVLCSMLFRPSDRLVGDGIHLIPWTVALAAKDAVTAVASVSVGFKWPNDLVAVPAGAEGHGRLKVGGILSQTMPPDAVVVGIGINCNWPPGWPPPELATSAASLDRLSGRPVDRKALEAALLANVSARYATLDSPAGRRHVVVEMRRGLTTIGALVQITTHDEVFVGLALDVDDSGHLLVDAGACTRIVDAGDVVHLRAVGRTSTGRGRG